MNNPSGRVKVELNLPALESILGGQSEAEISIRNAIVQEFAKKHLKAIANSETVKRAGEIIRAGVYEEVANQIGVWKYGKVELQTDIKRAVKEHIETEVSRHINDMVDGYVQKAVAGLEEFIQAKVKAAVKSNIDVEVRNQVRAKLQAANEALNV